MSASVLATVLVVSALMLLLVLGVLMLWNTDFVFFSRVEYLSRQRANVESAFVLYSVDSTLTDRLDEQRGLQLYDSSSDSRIQIEICPWGLYEVVRVQAADARIASTRLFGVVDPVVPLRNNCCNLWYVTQGATLSLTGRTALHGYLRLPRNGVQYGQIRSTFFCGEQVVNEHTAYAGEKLPALRSNVRSRIDTLFDWLVKSELWEPIGSQLITGFCDGLPLLLDAGPFCANLHVEGMSILVGDEITLDSTCRLNDVLVVGRMIRVEEGFQGRAQLFAEDTLLVGDRVNLRYPSGVFVARKNPKRYLEIGANSRVEGYAIVDGVGEYNVIQLNYRQARTAVLRGLLWVDGSAQVQGIVSGCIVANGLVYYSSEGYYEDMLYDLTLLENPAMAYPLWAVSQYKRKEAGWLHGENEVMASQNLSFF